jgi:hypothetical protein
VFTKGNGGDAACALARRSPCCHHPAEYHNQHLQGTFAGMDGRDQVTKHNPMKITSLQRHLVLVGFSMEAINTENGRSPHTG